MHAIRNSADSLVSRIASLSVGSVVSREARRRRRIQNLQYVGKKRIQVKRSNDSTLCIGKGESVQAVHAEYPSHWPVHPLCQNRIRQFSTQLLVLLRIQSNDPSKNTNRNSQHSIRLRTFKVTQASHRFLEFSILDLNTGKLCIVGFW